MRRTKQTGAGTRTSNAKKLKPKWRRINSDFDPASKRFYGALVGRTGTGKTTLACTLGGNLKYFNFFENWEGTLHNAAENRLVDLGEFGVVRIEDREAMSKEARRTLDQFFVNLEDAANPASDTGLIIIDTFPEFWELVRDAEFGGLKPEKGRVDRNYENPNATMNRMLNLLKEQNHAHVVFLAQLRDEWVNKETAQGTKLEKTGKQTISGPAKLQEKVPIILTTYYEEKRKSLPGRKGQTMTLKEHEYCCRVDKPFYGMSHLRGKVFKDSDMEEGRLNLPEILGMMTGTEWE